MNKPITIHDIAKMAGASSATVSRVLSKSGYPVSRALREKIERIAAEANYIPNQLGKQLKKNASMTIGVVIPSITNPFYSSVLFGIEEVARQHQYTVMVCNSLQDPALEDEYIRTMMEKQVKGLIISSITCDKSQLRVALDMGLSVVAIDQNIEGDPIPQIDFDYRGGGRMATRYLLEKGHRRIGYATLALDRPSRKQIYRGYLDAMAEAGLAPLVEIAGAEDAYRVDYEFDTGRALTERLLAAPHPPTAVFGCNDLVAFGVIHALSSRGLRVPEDVSVIGFDGIDLGRMIHPPLTTIKQPDEEMGRIACRMLLGRMNSGSGEEESGEVRLQPLLLERRSVAAAGGGQNPSQA